MKLLLDTHTLLWTILDTQRLPSKALDTIQAENNEVYVSSISYWEISIKSRLGKIELYNLTTSDLIPSATEMGFISIGLLPEEAVSQHKLLEDTHFDPFDRMLIWQAIQRDLILASADIEFRKFEKFGLKTLWK